MAPQLSTPKIEAYLGRVRGVASTLADLLETAGSIRARVRDGIIDFGAIDAARFDELGLPNMSPNEIGDFLDQLDQFEQQTRSIVTRLST
jgi:hypothetical protein